MLRTALLAALVCALTPSLAHAQLYSWKDTNGRLVISDQPKDPAAKTYALAYIGSPYAVTNQVGSRHASEFDPLISHHPSQHALRPALVRPSLPPHSPSHPPPRS